MLPFKHVCKINDIDFQFDYCTLDCNITVYKTNIFEKYKKRQIPLFSVWFPLLCEFTQMTGRAFTAVLFLVLQTFL